MQPTIGRVVHVVLTALDANAINKRRKDRALHIKSTEYVDTGYVAHVGNEVREGDVFPAIIVRVWPGGLINAQVFLDGADTYWITSRAEAPADAPSAPYGAWFWPPRV